MEQAKNEKPSKKKFTVGLVFLIIGGITAVAGAIFLIFTLLKAPAIEDGEFLVEKGRWKIEGEPGVIWEFSEIGKGTVTTNNHLNDYDFIWAIEGSKLKIKTNWLYKIYNEFNYKIEGDNLILNSEESGEVKLSPASSVDTEVTEDDELVVGD